MMKSFPVTNLNRGQDGVNKWVDFGGYMRARVSSQSFKKALRDHEVFSGRTANRTVLAPRMIADMTNLDEEGKDKVSAALTALGTGEDKGSKRKDNESDTQTNQIVVMSDREMRAIAEEAERIYRRNGEITKKDAQSIKGQFAYATSPDIAMFGRMSTSSALCQVTAAVRVAHAISMNECKMETDLTKIGGPGIDFFSAVDSGTGEVGASMIGNRSFSAPNHLFYLNVDIPLLVRNLDGDVSASRETVRDLLTACYSATPSGNRTTMNGDVMPYYAMAEVFDSATPCTYVNAYSTPLGEYTFDEVGSPKRAGENGIAVALLRDEAEMIRSAFGIKRQTFEFDIYGRRGTWDQFVEDTVYAVFSA